MTKLSTVSTLFVPKEPRLGWTEFPLVSSSKATPLPIKNGEAFHFYQARYALFHGIRLLGIHPGDKILVPAFHCSTLIEGVLRAGADVVFYNVKPSLIADLDDLEKKIDNQTRGVLLVHFFGVFQPMKSIQKICLEKGLRLIEDCAHILKGQSDGKDLGTFGDISIFSWRKFFKIPNGGMLVVPNAKYQGRTIQLQPSSFFQDLRDVRWGISQCLELWRQQPKQWESVPGLKYSDPHGDFDEQVSSREESWFSQNYLQNCSLEKVSSVRKAHWKSMANSLADLSIYPSSWGNIWQDAVSWAFPLLMTGYDNFHVELRKRGIPAFTWGGVIHQKLNLQKFPDAELLYSNLVLLPIHQDLSPLALEYMAETVRTLVKKQ